MSGALPEFTHIYKGLFSDGSRWKDFEHRPGDIFVCTPPKCGTTWTQAICALLVFQTPELKVNPAEISPWFDAVFEPIEEHLSMLKAQTHRRIIKTHTPLDGIPYFEDCSYVAIYRDPRDVFFSMRNHVGNMKIDVMADNLDMPPDEAFRTWVATHYTAGSAESFSLESVVHHFQTFKSFEHLPNVALYHYSNMKRDLPAEMMQMAAHLGIDVSPTLVSELAKTAGFENMQANAEQFAPGAKRDVWHETKRFFNKGTSGQWGSVLSSDDIALFDKALAQLVTPDLARWLVEGRS